MNEDETRTRPLESEAAELLRTERSVPGGEDYWDALHASIMARIASAGAEGHAWWTVLSRWTKPALVAAAAIVIVATAAIIALGAPRTAIAYDDLLEAQVPVQTVRATPSGSAREATFQFVMSSNGGRIP